MALNPQLDRHKILLTTIADHIGSVGEEYEKFVEHFKGYVPRGLLSAKKNLLGKFEALATKGHLGPGKYEVLKKISKDSGNIDILDLIAEAEEDIRNLDNPATAENADHSTSAGLSGSRTSGQKATSAGPSRSRATDIENHKDRPDLLHRLDGNHGYYDNKGKRGLLLILNFTENRIGSELDVENLKAFFGPEGPDNPDGLNFEIYEKHDLTKRHVEAAIEDVQHKLNGNDSKRYYCFVCVVLSHGDEVGINTRGNRIKPTDEIVKSFSNRSIPNFAGRPKLFFIQACRGRDNQLGQHVDSADDEVNQNAAENNYGDEADEIIYIPIDADTLTAYATTLGYRSWRRKNVGSWFITECMNVFKDYHKQDHVEDMLITVREKVALSWVVKDDGVTKQMPCVNTTLTHRLMFTKSE